MSRIRTPLTLRCERAPLCDLQNEKAGMQRSPPSVKVCEVYSDQKENCSKSPIITDCDENVCSRDAHVTFKSFTCSWGEVEISDRTDLSNRSVLISPHSLHALNTTVSHEDCEGEHKDHPYCRNVIFSQQEDHTAKGHPPLSHAGSPDITFMTFSCPGGEVEIAGQDSIVHDKSFIDEDPDSEIPSHGFEGDVIDEHTELPSRHFDHQYCNTQTSDLRSGKMVEEGDNGGGDGGSRIPPSITKNISDITLQSFTSSGGDIKVTEESFGHSESPIFDESLIKNGSFVETELLICHESIVQDESLIAEELDGKKLQSESCNEHTELPNHHFDQPYHPDPTKSVSMQAATSTFDASHSGRIISMNDSYMALNHSVGAQRGDDTTFRFSGAEEELENRVSNMFTPMKGLNFSHQTSSSSELREESGDGVIICGDEEHLSFKVVRNDPGEMVCQNEAHLSIHASSSGISESAMRTEGSSERMFPECSSDSTEVQSGNSVQQQDPHQHPSANFEEHVLQDEDPQLGCDVEEVCSDKNKEESNSCSSVFTISESVSSSETQNMQNTDLIIQNTNVLTQSHPETLRSESVDLKAQIKMWSHIVVSEPPTPKHSAFGHLWLPESPIPPPQLHSTVLAGPPTPKPMSPLDHKFQKEKVMKDLSAVGKGPLHDQLRKMGELLIAASGKISSPAAVTPVQQHSACVWTSPTPQQERSTNTSAIMEQKREIEVLDACTSTDCLLWSVSRSNLECLSRSELEQKMISTISMVEILSQQLTSAQNRTEPSPSQLRDQFVQTERTEFSQMEPYRELYLSALGRIQTLEIDQETLQSLHQTTQIINNNLVTVKSVMEETLSSMKELEAIVTSDQEIQTQQVGQMKALVARSMDTLRKMDLKNGVCVKNRDDMKQQMEDTLEEKSMVLRVLEQLRIHHTTQVSDLQHNLGSHEKLTAALTHTYPQLVELNRMHVDSVFEANTLLRETLNDHTNLLAELHKAQELLQRTQPVLHQLQRRAATAVQQSAIHLEERDRVIQDREQMEQQLYDSQSNLQEARQQIADLSTQITIMSSEMVVLREQLNEVEDERSQLQRKATELSATVSSTLASYAFLEQTLALENSKLQRSLHDAHEATERAESLQNALCVCEKRVEELEQMMVQRESLISELTTETENQKLQLRRLTQVQNELCNTKEMSEFLQAENELTREQLAESERLLLSHLQGLREKNLECEDLRVERQQLRAENECLQQELVSTCDKARLMLLDQGEQLAQATLDTSLLLQRVCVLITNTHNTQSDDSTAHTDPAPRPQPCSSFLNSVISALTEEPPSDPAPPTDEIIKVSCATEEDPIEAIGNGPSAFTRITPAQSSKDDAHSTTLLELLWSLGKSVSELHSAIEQLKQHKDSEIHTLDMSIRNLQEALEVEKHRHAAEKVELKQQVGRLKGQVEKDTQVLQQKTENENALRKLCSELEEKQEAAQTHRTENNELRRQGADLRQELQQSQVEIQALRAELKSTGQSAARMKETENRICLLREVEKLKASLLEVEESRSKLLERAKRHQMVHAMNQSKMERELHLLDDMIETVRKALSSIPDVVTACPELQKLVEYLG